MYLYFKEGNKITDLGMRNFPKGDWKNLTYLNLSIISIIKGMLLSVIRPANTSQNAICPI